MTVQAYITIQSMQEYTETNGDKVQASSTKGTIVSNDGHVQLSFAYSEFAQLTWNESATVVFVRETGQSTFTLQNDVQAYTSTLFDCTLLNFSRTQFIFLISIACV